MTPNFYRFFLAGLLLLGTGIGALMAQQVKTPFQVTVTSKDGTSVARRAPAT